MDNLWLLLLIVGAVISLTQKNHKQRPQHEPEDEEQARDVLQRQLEEIFGRRGEHHDTPHPTATPIPTPTPQRKEGTHHTATVPRPSSNTQATPTPRRADPNTEISAAASARNTSHRNIAATQPATRRQPQEKPSATAAATPHDNSDVGRIIEDFDMERAVIYAEILKPKYEEY